LSHSHYNIIKYDDKNTKNILEIGKYYTAFIKGKHVVPSHINPARYFGKYMGIVSYDMTSDFCDCERICHCIKIENVLKHRFEGYSYHLISNISNHSKVWNHYSDSEINQYNLVFQEYVDKN